MKTKLAFACLFLAFAVAPASGATLINANFYAFTPSSGTFFPEDPSSLAGPAGGLGTAWNQFAANSGANLVDANGVATVVGFTTDFTEGRYDGTAPDLTMLRATLTDFGRNIDRTFTLFGLEPGIPYDVWLVSHRHQGPDAERQAGEWRANNPTSSPVTQIVDGRGAPLNGSSFVAGQNFVLFENVIADGNGEISFEASPFQDQRFHFSGFQIMQVPEPSSAMLAGLGGLLVFARRRR